MVPVQSCPTGQILCYHLETNYIISNLSYFRLDFIKKILSQKLGVVANTFNPSILEAEAGGFL